MSKEIKKGDKIWVCIEGYATGDETKVAPYTCTKDCPAGSVASSFEGIECVYRVGVEVFFTKAEAVAALKERFEAHVERLKRQLETFLCKYED